MLLDHWFFKRRLARFLKRRLARFLKRRLGRFLKRRLARFRKRRLARFRKRRLARFHQRRRALLELLLVLQRLALMDTRLVGFSPGTRLASRRGSSQTTSLTPT